MNRIIFIILFFLFQFKFHNQYQTLHGFVGKECLPSEYGGRNGKIDHSKSMKFILAHEQFLAQNRKYGYKC